MRVSVLRMYVSLCVCQCLCMCIGVSDTMYGAISGCMRVCVCVCVGWQECGQKQVLTGALQTLVKKCWLHHL